MKKLVLFISLSLFVPSVYAACDSGVDASDIDFKVLTPNGYTACESEGACLQEWKEHNFQYTETTMYGCYAVIYDQAFYLGVDHSIDNPTFVAAQGLNLAMCPEEGEYQDGPQEYNEYRMGSFGMTYTCPVEEPEPDPEPEPDSGQSPTPDTGSSYDTTRVVNAIGDQEDRLSSNLNTLNNSVTNSGGFLHDIENSAKNIFDLLNSEVEIDPEHREIETGEYKTLIVAQESENEDLKIKLLNDFESLKAASQGLISLDSNSSAECPVLTFDLSMMGSHTIDFCSATTTVYWQTLRSIILFMSAFASIYIVFKPR